MRRNVAKKNHIYYIKGVVKGKKKVEKSKLLKLSWLNYELIDLKTNIIDHTCKNWAHMLKPLTSQSVALKNHI